MAVLQNNILAGAAGQGGAAEYVIPKSLRFNPGDSPYLNKVFPTSGNRRTYTLSFWHKQTTEPVSGTDNVLFGHMVSGYQTQTMVRINGNGQLEFGQFTGSWNFRKITSRLLRDPSSFYHIVISVNTTDATAEDRIKIYVNGVRETEWSTNTNPAQNLETLFNSNVEHGIGKATPVTQGYCNGLLADIQFVDGQALAPTDFGETRSDDGVWVPKKFNGNYGTNGFKLDFSDSSTNEALGFDSAPTTPDPDPKKGFDVVTYTGNGGTQNIGGLGFEPGLIWLKSRSESSRSHSLYDNVRGASKVLKSDVTDGEVTMTGVTSFNPDGFALGSHVNSNNNNVTYVAWNWRAGGPAVSNTDGSITSQVSANTDYGFSVVKWTANNTYATIGHGLTNQTPKFILVKSTASGTSWVVYHHSLGNTRGLNLNLSGAGGTDQDYWNNTSPTTSVFSVGNFANYQTAEHVAYVWSEVPGYSKFGSYTGNGSSTGPVVTTGFKPKWVLIKRTDSGPANWYVLDTERDPSNPVNALLRPNQDSAEVTAVPIDILSTGFQPKDTDAGSNASGGTYIYAAFADRPGNNWDVNNIVTNEGLSTNKKNFDILTYTGNAATQTFGKNVYSSTSTLGSPTYAFDGNTSTGGVFDSSGNKVLTANSITINTSLEIYHNRTGSDGITVNINGTNYTATGLSSNGYHTIPIPNSDLPLTTTGNITIKDNQSGASSTVYAVRVDGNVLLDNTGPGLSFQPDLVWIKSTSHNYNHYFYDSVRGVTKSLKSNSTDAETTIAEGLKSFNSDGFTLGNDSNINYTNRQMVAWCFKAGGAAVSNTDGTITSSVSANPSSGFSIVSWTGDGSSSATVGHSLGVAPKMVIIKGRETTNGWSVYHKSLTSNYVVNLQTTSAQFANSASVGGGTGTPTNSVLTFDSGSSNVNNVNKSGNKFIAYCFADVPGYQRIGSYTGNGSSTGPVVVTGFKPRFLLVKRIDSGSTDNWVLYDSERDSANPNSKRLFPNLSNAESDASGNNVDFLVNGFQPKSTSDGTNANGGNYIYLAIGDDEIGSDEDCLVDVPNAVAADADVTDTTGGYQRGNYATLNPLDHNCGSATFSEGSLKIQTPTNSGGVYVSSIATPTTGKWYAEVKLVTLSANQFGRVGLVQVGQPRNTSQLGNDPGQIAYRVEVGDIRYNLSTLSTGGSAASAGDILGLALDLDNQTLKVFKNGVLMTTASNIPQYQWFFAGSDDYTTYSATHEWNFGQQRFKYGLPFGYKALNTTALPPATIEDGSAYFDAKPYVGNGSTQTITGFSFQPSFLWTKVRDQPGNHKLVDAVRGVSKRLESDTTDAEETATTGVTSFNSDGFTVGSSGTQNGNNYSLMSWAWNAGSSTVSNTDGTITSSVRANPSAGFSIITYTGNGSANQTIGHGLNDKPSLIIIKSRDNARNWVVIPTFINDKHFFYLNSDSELLTGLTSYYGTHTSSVVGITGSSSGSNSNANGENYVCYAFAPVAGYSAFGTYTGNASATDGPFIYTGFKPALVVIKRTDSANDWNVQDYQRKAYNGQLTTSLQWNTNSSESSVGSGYERDLLSNGFKIRNTGTETNANGGTHLYLAFAQNPFQANGGLAR